MKCSILIPFYKKEELLSLCIGTLISQITSHNTEIVLLDDEFVPNENIKALCLKHKLKYIHTGKTKNNMNHWRVPGYALNIGVKQSNSEIIILTGPEIHFLSKTCVENIIGPLKADTKLITIPEHVFYDDGYILGKLKQKAQFDVPKTIDPGIPLGKLDPYNFPVYHPDYGQMPYLWGFHKKEFMEIGGYDEDFTGIAAEDMDLRDRLILNGLKYKVVKGDIIHLYHKRQNLSGEPRYEYNCKLWLDRKGTIKRNVNKNWGTP